MLVPNSKNPTFPDESSSLLRRYWLALLVVALITLAHYNTAFHIHALHGIYRRLYYFPIILAAFRGGTAGGLGFAVLVCAVYLPHAMGKIGFDPGSPLEKGLEMALYIAVGLLSGILVSRIDAAKRRLQATARDLQRTLDEKSAVENELVRSARLAAVGRLSAGLAHEIRNPLASIRGAAEVLVDDYPEQNPKRRLLDILLEESGRLNTVLTRFLTFARSEPGTLQPFNLVTEAEAVVDLLAHQPETPQVILTGTEKPILALGNQQQIRQVILNLALNAAAMSPAGQPLEISLGMGKNSCFCAVQDQGPGFSPEDLENFGTPFYSARKGGTGLGLATSLRIVEDQGGTLTVDPNYQQGARVVLELPLTDSESEN